MSGRRIALAPTVALALAFASAASGRAQDTASVASVTTTSAWVLSLGTKGKIGREEVRLETAGGRAALVSTAEVKLTEQPFRYEARLELADGQPTRYTLTSAMHQIEVTVEGAKVKVQATIAGSALERTLDATGPVVVLDNLVCAHYDRLAGLALAPGATGEVKFSAVIPQILRVLPGTVTRVRETRVVGPGGERKALVSTVTLGNVAITLVHDAETAVAYRVFVPGQEFEGVREGWREASPESAGPGPGQRGDAAAELPPLPPVREVEVRFDAPQGPVPGTLTLPATGDGPFPCVVLLHGSGPQDRDETIGPNKPFRDLCHELAGRGVASLRYDKRTWLLVQVLRDLASTAEQRRATNVKLRGMTLVEEAIEDGAAALQFLGKRPEVRPDALFVLGHSLGGLAAPDVIRANAGPGRVRGLILVAAPGRPLLDLMIEQVTLQGTLMGASPEEAAEEAKSTLAPLADAGLHLELEATYMGASGRYWRDVLARDPLAGLRACKQPVLLIQGGKDCQVSVKDHEALLAAGNERAGASTAGRLFPALNHLLVRVAGERSTGAEYQVPGRVDDAAADAIAGWILDRCRDGE